MKFRGQMNEKHFIVILDRGNVKLGRSVKSFSFLQLQVAARENIALLLGIATDKLRLTKTQCQYTYRSAIGQATK
jgi:hypothetical protein